MVCDKIEFSTLAEAKQTASGMSYDKGAHMKPYRCQECGKFHLATNNKYKKNRSAKKPVKIPLKANQPSAPFMKQINYVEPTRATYKIGQLIKLKELLNNKK